MVRGIREYVVADDLGLREALQGEVEEAPENVAG